jgi:transposase InsO family protein
MNSAGGRCHDNAKCESLWGRFKEELLYDKKLLVFSCLLEYRIKISIIQGERFDVYEASKFPCDRAILMS